jgi:hypothetical protein
VLVIFRTHLGRCNCDGASDDTVVITAIITVMATVTNAREKKVFSVKDNAMMQILTSYC